MRPAGTTLEKQSSSGGAIGADLGSASVQHRLVTVSCGTKEMQDTFVGKTVAAIRDETREFLQIPEGAQAILNGQPVDKATEEVILVSPGSLEFVHRTGIKG